MSGFFGMVRTDGAVVGKELLDLVRRSLEFRGPDGTQTWANGAVGFCFSFFDVISPHQARLQPVHLGGRHSFVGDMRLHARKELLAELQAKDQPATQSCSDAELLLFSWNLWGAACLERILGDFSFGIWDAAEQSLFCARDFTGARPLFYAQGPGVFCFTNTLQTLQLVPEISRELDDLFVRDFLLQGLSSDPERTVWRDVRRLPAGHGLHFSNGKFEVKRFLQLPIEDPLRLKHADEYQENFRELLHKAVSDRLPEGKTSLYLSGGLDSASVCAVAAGIASRRGTMADLKAFTVSWRPLMGDPEPEFAKCTAHHLGLAQEILEEARILPYDVAAEELPPEPTSEVFWGRACRIFRAIGAHSRVVLSGDGGDNVLEGQAWPFLQYLRKRGHWGTIARSFAGYLLTHGRIPPLRAGFRSWLRLRFRQQDAQEQTPPWFTDEFSNRLRARPAAHGTTKESLPAHPTHPWAYRSLHSGYWPSVLEDEDAGCTRILLETRAPFLDVRLLRFLLRLPPVPWCMDKELTRRSMRGSLPVEILRRHKTPLLRDPLNACQEEAGWRPELVKKPPKSIHEFVKWNSWLATLSKPTGSFTWENSYPLSFALWLKAIENKKGIQ